MNSELANKIEMTEMVYRFCLSIRKMKNRPELAAVAAEREMQFKRELDALLEEKKRNEQLELSVKGEEVHA